MKIFKTSYVIFNNLLQKCVELKKKTFTIGGYNILVKTYYINYIGYCKLYSF